MKIYLNLLFKYIKIDSIFVVYYMLAYCSVIDHCFHQNRETDEYYIQKYSRTNPSSCWLIMGIIQVL